MANRKKTGYGNWPDDVLFQPVLELCVVLVFVLFLLELCSNRNRTKTNKNANR